MCLPSERLNRKQHFEFSETDRPLTEVPTAAVPGNQVNNIYSLKGRFDISSILITHVVVVFYNYTVY